MTGTTGEATFLNALQDEIADQRREHHVTQEDMARVIELSQGYVSLRIMGKRPWTIDDLVHIAPLFGGMEPVDLFEKVVERARSRKAKGPDFQRIKKDRVKAQRPIKA